jgi:hypothetical protein
MPNQDIEHSQLEVEYREVAFPRRANECRCTAQGASSLPEKGKQRSYPYRVRTFQEWPDRRAQSPLVNTIENANWPSNWRHQNRLPLWCIKEAAVQPLRFPTLTCMRRIILSSRHQSLENTEQQDQAPWDGNDFLAQRLTFGLQYDTPCRACEFLLCVCPRLHRREVRYILQIITRSTAGHTIFGEK